MPLWLPVPTTHARCLLPNGLRSSSGRMLNKLSSELWFARNKGSCSYRSAKSLFISVLSSQVSISSTMTDFATILIQTYSSTPQKFSFSFYFLFKNQKNQLSVKNSTQYGLRNSQYPILVLSCQWSIHKSCGGLLFWGCQNGLLMMSLAECRHLQKP